MLSGDSELASATRLIWLGSFASLVAGLGTGIGALGVFFIRRLSERIEDADPLVRSQACRETSFSANIGGEQTGELSGTRFQTVIAGILLAPPDSIGTAGFERVIRAGNPRQPISTYTYRHSAPNPAAPGSRTAPRRSRPSAAPERSRTHVAFLGRWTSPEASLKSAPASVLASSRRGVGLGPRVGRLCRPWCLIWAFARR